MSISARYIERKWGEAHAEGDTTAVCRDTDTPDQAARRLNLTHIREISGNDGGMVAGLNEHGRLLAIAHDHGPCACYIQGISAEAWRGSLLEADN
jgi:hypothetical protein